MLDTDTLTPSATLAPAAKPTWLVEERTCGPMGGDETIPFHAVVTGWPTPQWAFEYAQGMAGREFLFAADELVEVVPGYMWAAADGSCVAYEVRKIG